MIYRELLFHDKFYGPLILPSKNKCLITYLIFIVLKLIFLLINKSLASEVE